MFDGKQPISRRRRVGTCARLGLAEWAAVALDCARWLITLVPRFRSGWRSRGGRRRFAIVAWSPDGHWIAAAGGSDLFYAGGDGVVWLWRVDSGECLLLEGHSGPVSQIAWSPDSRTVASGSGDSTVRLWEAATGSARPSSKATPTGSIAWRGRRTAARSQRVRGTRRCGCGRRRRAGAYKLEGHPKGSGAWRGRPTAAPWPAAGRDGAAVGGGNGLRCATSEGTSMGPERGVVARGRHAGRGP